MSRIFQSIGANPNSLGFFFIFPGLMGMIGQPLIGKYSDRTWNRFERRMPYLLFGAPISALVLLMLPFSDSLGFGYGSMAAMVFAAFAVCFMDLFNNICMQPFRMIVGDMVNNKQKNFAWSLQQIFFNGGGNPGLPAALYLHRLWNAQYGEAGSSTGYRYLRLRGRGGRPADYQYVDRLQR